MMPDRLCFATKPAGNTHQSLLQRIVLCCACLSLCVNGLPALADDSAKLDAEQLKFFESKIRPVLIKECYGCHSNQSGNARGGLRLDTRQLTRIGGDGGAAVVPGDLDESLLWAAINYDGYEMPPKRQLSDAVIEDFRIWIENGAPDPRDTEVTAIQATISAKDIADAKENFWAFQEPSAAELSQSSLGGGWAATKIDQHVVNKLRSEGLRPVGDASPETVLRRLTFGLVGLPPTQAQKDQFMRDVKSASGSNRTAAIERLTDQLLASPQFGERWGRHWLDVARYAESTGRGVNMTYPHAWRYRDYVIDSFNEDKSYFRFVQEQLAGDLLPAPTDAQWAENLVATTFLAIGPKDVNQQNPVQFAADLVDEQIDVTTRVFLGQSVACARCHDHKFDPIPQTDYYAMAGIFADMKTYFGNPPSEYGGFRTPQTKRNSSLLLLPIKDANPYDKAYSKAELAKLKNEIEKANQKLAEVGPRNQTNNQQQRLRLLNEIAQLSAKLAVLDDNGNPRSYCMGVQDPDKPRDVRVLARGEIDAPGQLVPRGFPQALCSVQPDLSANSSGRLELARWIGSPENPLTSRVMVNRIWQHLFGRGLVSTPENFGTTGAAPSNAELLDYLAMEFQASGGSVKSLIRQIVTSHVYRIDSRYDERSFQVDPENEFLWRFSPRRLDAESIRDAMLQVSGELDLKRPRGSLVAKAGYKRLRDGTLTSDRNEARREVIESVRKRLKEEGISPNEARRGRRKRGESTDGKGRSGRQLLGQLQGRGKELAAQEIKKTLSPLEQEDANHRSVYLAVVRDQVPRSLDVFDFADPDSSVGKRESSNTANQALYMMNNPFVIRQSDALAKRIAKENRRSIDQLKAVFGAIYGRSPTSNERSAASTLVRSLESPSNGSKTGDGLSPKTLSALCQSLFASAEFLYLD